jgi:hypothetical protein
LNFTLDPVIALPLAALAALASAALWYFLVRPVPEQTATGTILDRQFAAAETVRRSTTRAHRSFEHIPQDRDIHLPDRHVYTIRLEGVKQDVYYTAPAAAAPLEIGRAVTVIYQHRWIPFAGHRYFVREVTPVSEPH